MTVQMKFVPFWDSSWFRHSSFVIISTFYYRLAGRSNLAAKDRHY